MNAKAARKLRQIARNATIGMQSVAYVRGRDGRIEVDERTTRGVYLELKRKAAAR